VNKTLLLLKTENWNIRINISNYNWNWHVRNRLLNSTVSQSHVLVASAGQAIRSNQLVCMFPAGRTSVVVMAFGKKPFGGCFFFLFLFFSTSLLIRRLFDMYVCMYA